jgi:hypothetical protein
LCNTWYCCYWFCYRYVSMLGIISKKKIFFLGSEIGKSESTVIIFILLCW